MDEVTLIANVGIGGALAFYILRTTNAKLDTLINEVRNLTACFKPLRTV